MPARYFEGSRHATDYSQFRPAPPDSVIKRILEYMRDSDKAVGNTDGFKRSLAVDVGCGGGQATLTFANYFDKVVAFDISKAQVEEAERAKQRCGVSNVEFTVRDASVPFPVSPCSVDLVLCVAAAHWLDLPKFYANADVALKSGDGVIAIVDTSITTISPLTDPSEYHRLIKVREDLLTALTPFQPPEYYITLEETAAWAKANYVDVEVTGNREMSVHYLEEDSSLFHYCGFLSTISSFQKAKRQLGEEGSKKILSDFAKGVKMALGYKEDVAEERVKMRLRTYYGLMLARKPCKQ